MHGCLQRLQASMHLYELGLQRFYAKITIYNATYYFILADDGLVYDTGICTR